LAVGSVLSGLWRAIGLAVLINAAYASFSFPGYHFVVLTHLHNLVPLIFLWDWARRLGTSPARLAFRLAQALWILLVPLLILLGLATAESQQRPEWRRDSSATAARVPRFAPEAAATFDARVRCAAGTFHHVFSASGAS
jgi:hypothetical protein